MESSMISIRRAVAPLVAVGLTIACSEAPTAPQADLRLSHVIIQAVDPTLVTFNSASCTLASASTGQVSCSWNISNPDANVMNLWAEGILVVNYQCVNPKNGRIASSEQREISTLQQFFSVSATSLTGSNSLLPLPNLPNDLRGKQNRENACRGNGEPQGMTWRLDYWDVSVITVGGIQRFSCAASDNRNGCFTL
jgi:hypothetical protein